MVLLRRLNIIGNLLSRAKKRQRLNSLGGQFVQGPRSQIFTHFSIFSLTFGDILFCFPLFWDKVWSLSRYILLISCLFQFQFIDKFSRVQFSSLEFHSVLPPLKVDWAKILKQHSIRHIPLYSCHLFSAFWANLIKFIWISKSLILFIGQLASFILCSCPLPLLVNNIRCWQH